MNKKYILAVVVIIFLTILGIYINFSGNNTPTSSPNTESEVLGISDDLKITNKITSFTDEGNDTFLISYQYDIAHAGNYPAEDVMAHGWFNETDRNTFEIVSFKTSSAELTLNPNFNGTTDRNLLANQHILPPLYKGSITVTIRLSYKDRSIRFIGYVDIAGKSEFDDESSSSSNSSTASSHTTSKSQSTSKPSSSKTSTSKSSSTSQASTPSRTTNTGSSSRSSTSRTSSTSKPSSSSSQAAAPTTPPAEVIVDPIITVSSSAPVRSGRILGLYDEDQVTFFLPMGVAGEPIIESTGGKGQ